MLRAVTISKLHRVANCAYPCAWAGYSSQFAFRAEAAHEQTSRQFSSSTSNISTSGKAFASTVAAVFASGAFVAGICASQQTQTTSQAEAASSEKVDKRLPTIRKSEVARHTTKDTGIWVTYLDGVYDVTEFVDMHPGGNKILLAAGKSIAPYWAMYAVHKTPETREILEEYRIGNLPPEEAEAEVATSAYANEPERSPRLRVLTTTPFNGETPAEVLEREDITPNELHFKRHHLPVPLVEDEAYELTVGGDLEGMTLSLEDLRRFPKHTVRATLQCSGNRRTEMAAARRKGLPPVRGLPWHSGALSTAEWSGARLRDVLLAAGVSEDSPNCPFIFVGLDTGATGERYEASIPIEKAMSVYGDVLLAYEMNGEPLPRDHGYPVRAIVPGTTAARSVKWVYQVLASDEECTGFWQQNDYKAFCPSQDPNTVDWSSAPAMQEFPVTSFITSPRSGDKIPPGQKEIEIKGIAIAGGGRA
eukprot:CAMPEP_0177625942 /NCGR_PEP_ID=MMETSP0419_2-20121207/30380_1 /TAXON_ID=582737 /ORGANISM="Tetraselmis sp., Strain GSL018" /LENGTH=475 /DNA_ID=CAMNT_0019126945 /DNA_START=25 /DNA_END=1448 /DNA_ORIENTATION=-